MKKKLDPDILWLVPLRWMTNAEFKLLYPSLSVPGIPEFKEYRKELRKAVKAHDKFFKGDRWPKKVMATLKRRKKRFNQVAGVFDVTRGTK